MTELEARLHAAAATLDASAPRFDPALLTERPRRRRLLVAAAVVAAVAAGVVAQPDARSAVERFLGIETVEDLGPVEHGVAPPILGVELSPVAAEELVPFAMQDLDALGEPDFVYGRLDVRGGMISLLWNGGVVLTEWPDDRVDATVTVANGGAAEQVSVGGRAAVWVEGEARGTFTVTGADGALHRETFRVEDGALLWSDGGVGFLLQGAGSRERAVRLASSVG